MRCVATEQNAAAETIMKKRITQWLAAIPVTDPVEQRQAHIFQLVLICWIAFISFADLLFVIFLNLPTTSIPPEAQVAKPFLLPLSALLWITPIVALVLLRRGRFKLAVTIAALGLLFAHSNAALLLGVTDGSVLVVFQLPIALAGLLGHRRLLVTTVGLVLAIALTVGFLESQVPPLAGPFMMNDTRSASEQRDTGLELVINLGFFISI